MFFLWLQKAIERYRYQPEHFDPNMWGITLQRNTLVPAGGRNMEKTVWSQRDLLYEYPLVGTWGQLAFPEHWREFRSYWVRQQCARHPLGAFGVMCNV
jgi:hypothetical protein